MTRAATKKSAAKKADPLAAVRADTPNVEATDLDRGEACYYCGRDAVARLDRNGHAICEVHRARFDTLEQKMSKL